MPDSGRQILTIGVSVSDADPQRQSPRCWIARLPTALCTRPRT